MRLVLLPTMMSSLPSRPSRRRTVELSAVTLGVVVAQNALAVDADPLAGGVADRLRRREGGRRGRAGIAHQRDVSREVAADQIEGTGAAGVDRVRLDHALVPDLAGFAEQGAGIAEAVRGEQVRPDLLEVVEPKAIVPSRPEAPLERRVMSRSGSRTPWRRAPCQLSLVHHGGSSTVPTLRHSSIIGLCRSCTWQHKQLQLAVAIDVEHVDAQGRDGWRSWRTAGRRSARHARCAPLISAAPWWRRSSRRWRRRDRCCA